MGYPTGVRSFHQSPHHYCDRCKCEFLLSSLQWQEGHLRCPRCVDTILVGEREAMIARKFEVPSKELQVDEKLNGESSGAIVDTIHFAL